MAAPLRNACVARYLRRCISVLKSDTGKQYLLSVAVNKGYSSKSEEDFYGIAADLQSPPEDEAALSAVKPSKEDAAVIESLLRRSKRRRKKSMEVTMETTFGHVRLDKAARKPFLESVSTEQFWKVIHSPLETCGEERNEASESPGKPKKSTKRAEKLTAAAAADPVLERKISHFDEVYFGQTASHKDLHKVTSLRRTLPFCAVSPEASGAYEKQEEQNDKHKTSMHLLHHHGQTSASDSSKTQEPIASDSYFDETYFSTVLETEYDKTPKDSPQESNGAFIENQYFAESSSAQATAKSHHDQKPEKADTAEEFNFIDSQYFDRTDSHRAGESSLSHVTSQYAVTDSNTHEMLSDYTMQEKENLHTPSTESPSLVSSSMRSAKMQQKILPETEDRKLELQENIQETTQTVEKIDTPRRYEEVRRESDLSEVRRRRTERAHQKDVKSSGHVSSHKEKDVKNSGTAARAQEEDKEETAYDVAMKIRKQIRTPGLKEAEEELSENKQRVLRFKEQVPDLYNMPSAEITKLLADSVIFENDDFIALSKPYGLPSHGGPSVRASVGQLLAPLAHRLDKGRGLLPTLHLVHRLDKETTGVMLLAKNAEVAWQLLGMFRRREVKKKYWAITKGVPQPLEGIVDIPLARQRVHGVYKTIVKPEKFVVGGKAAQQRWSRRDDRSMEAITEYRVLSHHDSMALVELRPTTGVQHQIRAHLAQGLNTPILGDHKYSHMDKLAPQRLFPEALQKLGIRQAQVRYLPMHLHAKSLVLPEWRGRNNIFINAAIPKYFLRNLRTLKIKIPKD